MISVTKAINYLILIDMLVQLITRVIFVNRTLLIWGNLLHGFILMAFFLGFWINDIRLMLAKDIPRGKLGKPSLFVFSPRAELSPVTKNIRMNVFKFLGATLFLVGYSFIFGMGATR